MNEIPIESKKETDTLPICRKSRKELVAKYHLVEMIALEYFNIKNLVHSDTEIPDKLLSHLIKCPKCIDWFHEITPKSVLKRQKRLTEYCCSGMFCAVEEHKERKQIKIEFTMFRGEDPCWIIDGKYAFISYCPWCGELLPRRPF